MPLALRRAALPALALAILAAAPAGAASTIDSTVDASGTHAARCHARLADGPGVARQTLATGARALVTARLHGTSGDWDLGLFTAAGRPLGGSAATGAADVAQALAPAGATVVVQACRRAGPTRVALTAGAAPVGADRGPRPVMARVALRTPAAADLLPRLGLDLSEHGRPGFHDVLLYGRADRRVLRRAGLRFRVQPEPAAHATPRANGDPLPSGNTEYRQLADYEADLRRLAEDHPAAVRAFTLPEPTLVGRPVQGIEIARDVHASDGRPAILVMGLLHAREWPAGEVSMEWAIDLAEGLAAGDPRIAHLLGRARVLVVPVTNPDGYALSRGGGAFEFKRRNCRITDGLVPAPGICEDPANVALGVDPNRNFGQFWGGPGASTNPTNDTYRGAAPFSEPESRNIRALLSGRQVTTVINNHTYSDLMLRPPSVRGQVAPDEGLLKALGDAMAAEAGSVSQHGYELYDTSGGADDWAYWATGALAFTPEIGPHTGGTAGFHPAFATSVPAYYHGTAGRGGLREAFMLALESTADTARHGIVTGSAPAGTTIELSKTFETETAAVLDAQGDEGPVQRLTDTVRSTLTVGPGGAFAAHVNPSTRPVARARPGRVAAGPVPAPVDHTGAGDTVSGGDDAATDPASYRDVPFSIGAAEDTIGVRVRLKSATPSDDFDLRVYREAGAVDELVGSSEFGDTDTELVELNGPAPNERVAPGDYYARAIDYASTDKVFQLTVRFRTPMTAAPERPESWTLRCLAPWGQELGRMPVAVDRGERVDVGGACPGWYAWVLPQQAPGAEPAAPQPPAEPAPGPATPAALAFTAEPRDDRPLGVALRRGLRLRAACDADCTVAAALLLDDELVATGGRTSATRESVIALRFDRAARRHLAGRRAAALHLVAIATADDGRRAVQRAAVTLRRAG